MPAVSTSSLKDRAIKSFIWNFLEKAGSQSIALIIQIVLARLLTPSDFGTMAIMVVFVNIGTVFVQSGLNTALIQKRDLTDLDVDTAFWLSFTIAALLYSILFFIAPFIASFYSMKYLVWPLRILCLIFLFNSYFAVQSALVTRDLEFKRLFKANLIAMIISGIAGISAAFLNLGIWALVAQQVIFSAVSALVIGLETKWLPKMKFSLSEAKTLYSFGWKLLASGLLETTYQSLSDLIVGKKYAASALGYFNQGKKYPMTLGTVLDNTIQPIMLSTVSKVQTDIVKVKQIVRRSLKLSTFIILPLMAFCAVAAESIICLVLGEQWIGSAPFFRAFCIVYALLPIHSTNLQALNGIGHTEIYLKLEVIKKIIGISILLLITFETNNCVYICYGYIVDGLISTFINAHPNKRLINYSYMEQIHDLLPTVLITLISSALSFSATFMVNSSSVICAVLEFFIFFAAYILLSDLSKNESYAYLRKEASVRLFGAKQ